VKWKDGCVDGNNKTKGSKTHPIIQPSNYPKLKETNDKLYIINQKLKS